MNKDHAIILLMVMVTLFLGGLFVHEKLAFKKNDQKNTVSVQNEQPATNEPDLETSDWKTYRNEKLGIEFQYPSSMSLVLDTEPGSSWGTEEEIMEEISLKRDDQSIVWIIHASKDSLTKNREHLQELSKLSEKDNECKIFQEETKLSINGVKVTRIKYRSYTLAGVNCNTVQPVYYFPLRDKSYIIMRADNWWSTEDDVRQIDKMALSLHLL